MNQQIALPVYLQGAPSINQLAELQVNALYGQLIGDIEYFEVPVLGFTDFAQNIGPYLMWIDIELEKNPGYSVLGLPPVRFTFDRLKPPTATSGHPMWHQQRMRITPIQALHFGMISTSSLEHKVQVHAFQGIGYQR